MGWRRMQEMDRSGDTTVEREQKGKEMRQDRNGKQLNFPKK